MTRPNSFRQRNAKIQVVDPRENVEQHGVHGQRSSGPSGTPSRRLMTVPIDRIRPNRYQKRETVDPEKYQQLKDQIEEIGFQFTAIICVDPDDDQFYNLMMGGHIRLQIAAELGYTETQAILQPYDRQRLAKGTYFENQGRQPLTLIEEGLLFQQIQEDEHWNQEKIAQELKVNRSHVSLCLLAATSAPDIQEMLRVDPKRGQRCFYYLRQLDELGPERAISLRAPIIQDFLSTKISTDQVKHLVEQILRREKGEEVGEVSNNTADVQEKVITVAKSFQRFEKALGERSPSKAEREELEKVKGKIEAILLRS